jgi:putative membrane protein
MINLKPLKVKKFAYLLLGITGLLSAQSCLNKHAKNYNQTTLVDQDGTNFILYGIEGGLTEVKASGVAITNSNNQRVISFAKMMIEDHTKAGDQLKKIESDKLVLEKDSISGDHQKMIDSLSTEKGAAFDKAYLQMMVTDHEKTIKLFTDASQNTDIEVRNFAAKTLPTIKMHLDSANAILRAIK